MLNAGRITRALRSAGRPVIAISALVLALAALSFSGLVGAVTAKNTGQTVKLTQVLFQTSSTGAPPASGSNSTVGTSDGRIGPTTIHGSVRGTNKYPAFTGQWTMFDPSGAIYFSLKGHVVAPGSFAGTANVTGGTGRYRHARGKLTFTAHTQSPMGGQSSPLIVRRLSGTLVLP